MNRNQAKEFYPILQAFAEGRVIECRTKPSAIEDENVPNEWAEINVIEFNHNKEYRIKPNLEPESEYRPFKDAIECWTEMRKHKPFSILKDKKDGHRIQISSISDGINSISSSQIQIFVVILNIEWLLRQPRDLERDHIEAVLRKSVELLYGKEE